VVPGRQREVLILACGDELRGDDGLAAAAVRGLPAATLARADVRVVRGLAIEDLVALPAGCRLVIVDAVAGPPAGELVELDLAALSEHAATVVSTSTHQLPLHDVVALAGLLREDPLGGCFVGLGVGSVTFGTELSEPVAAALPALREAIARAVRAID
jgi:hydrogenase maturation protease